MSDRYSNEAARAAGEAFDEDVPAWAIERIEALKKLAHDLYHAAGPQRCDIGEEGDPSGVLVRSSRLDHELERRACDLLDIDPPGFDPSTEGP